MTEQLTTSDRDTWLTPPVIWERAIQVMGGIDLDPASDEPPYNIPAAMHITKEQDALTMDWPQHYDATSGKMRPCRVFLNPPYNRNQDHAKFVRKLLHECNMGRVSQAIVLLAARTDTSWFRDLSLHRFCLVHGRLQFLDPVTHKPTRNSATFPSVVFGMNVSGRDFWRAYHDIGDVYERY